MSEPLIGAFLIYFTVLFYAVLIGIVCFVMKVIYDAWEGGKAAKEWAYP